MTNQLVYLHQSAVREFYCRSMACEITGLADLEKIIKDTEFENSRLLNQIEEEITVTDDLNKKTERQNVAVATLEEAMTRLAEEIATLNMQNRSNKDIAMSLKKSTYLIDNHVLELKRQLDNIIQINAQQSEKYKVSFDNYASKWSSYKTKWESHPLAKEVNIAKHRAEELDAEVWKCTEQLNKLNLKKAKSEERKVSAIEKMKKITDIIVKIAVCRKSTNDITKDLQATRKLLKGSMEEKSELDGEKSIEIPHQSEPGTEPAEEQESIPNHPNGPNTTGFSIVNPTKQESSIAEKSRTGSLSSTRQSSTVEEERRPLSSTAYNLMQIPMDCISKSKSSDTRSRPSFKQSQIRMPTTPTFSAKESLYKPPSTITNVPKIRIPNVPRIEPWRSTAQIETQQTLQKGKPLRLLQSMANLKPTINRKPVSNKELPLIHGIDHQRPRQHEGNHAASSSLSAGSALRREVSDGNATFQPSREDVRSIREASDANARPPELSPALEPDIQAVSAMITGIPLQHGKDNLSPVSNLPSSTSSSISELHIPTSRTEQAKKAKAPVNMFQEGDTSETMKDALQERACSVLESTSVSVDVTTNQNAEAGSPAKDAASPNNSMEEDTSPKDRIYELPLEHPISTPLFDYGTHGTQFHFSPGQHAEQIKKFTNSPGDGFCMSTRHMFNSLDPANEIEGSTDQIQVDNTNASSSFNNFFASSSFVSGNSFFSFGDSADKTPDNKDDQAEILQHGSAAGMASFWSNNEQDQAPNSQSNSGAFSLFSESSSNSACQGFDFGFASKSPEQSHSFSLF